MEWQEIDSTHDGWQNFGLVDPASGEVVAKVRQYDDHGLWSASVRGAAYGEFLRKEQAMARAMEGVGLGIVQDATP